MKLLDLPRARLVDALRGDGIYMRFGPFVTRVRSNAPAIADHLRAIYPHHRLETAEFAESTITIHRGRDRRRPWLRMVSLRIDERPFMYPLREKMAAPMLEWGMNWVIATRAHQFLLCHAAVLERAGRAVMLPAVSGAGKSTLCALLLSAGWRLFSDEFAVIRPSDGAILPMPRALSLKNQSIDIVKRIHAGAVFTESFQHTVKGTLAFMAAPQDAIERSGEAVALGMIVFPKFDAAASIDVEPVGCASAFADFVSHSMNYSALGRRGFECTAALVADTPIHKLTYGDTASALGWFEQRSREFA